MHGDVEELLARHGESGGIRLELREHLHGTQYTRIQYKKTLKVLGVTGEYIWYHTPEQNGHIESFHKTLKKEYVWPAYCARFRDVEEVVAKALSDYNQRRIRSYPGYLTLDEFARKWK